MAECGIKSIEDLRKASPSTVDEACKKKLGIAVVGAARQMPDFVITAKILKETVRVDGIGATCQFTISLKNVRSVKVTTKKGARKLTASILLMTSDNVSHSPCMKGAPSLTLERSNGSITSAAKCLQFRVKTMEMDSSSKRLSS